MNIHPDLPSTPYIVRAVEQSDRTRYYIHLAIAWTETGVICCLPNSEMGYDLLVPLKVPWTAIMSLHDTLDNAERAKEDHEREERELA